MKMLWCWRCRQEIPMLEPEEEYLARRAISEGMAFVAAEAKRLGQVMLPELPLSRIANRQRPLLEMYRLLTGKEELNPNAVWHHFTADYGPPCPQCHKPLRTPAARFCAACGYGMAEVDANTLPLVERQPDLFPAAQPE